METFIAVIHNEDGIYVADCPEIGTASQGYSVEEAIANLKEATELYLEESEYIPHGSTLIAPFSVQRTEMQRA